MLAGILKCFLEASYCYVYRYLKIKIAWDLKVVYAASVLPIIGCNKFECLVLWWWIWSILVNNKVMVLGLRQVTILKDHQ